MTIERRSNPSTRPFTTNADDGATPEMAGKPDLTRDEKPSSEGGWSPPETIASERMTGVKDDPAAVVDATWTPPYWPLETANAGDLAADAAATDEPRIETTTVQEGAGYRQVRKGESTPTYLVPTGDQGRRPALASGAPRGNRHGMISYLLDALARVHEERTPRPLTPEAAAIVVGARVCRRLPGHAHLDHIALEGGLELGKTVELVKGAPTWRVWKGAIAATVVETRDIVLDWTKDEDLGGYAMHRRCLVRLDDGTEGWTSAGSLCLLREAVRTHSGSLRDLIASAPGVRSVSVEGRDSAGCVQEIADALMSFAATANTAVTLEPVEKLTAGGAPKRTVDLLLAELPSFKRLRGAVEHGSDDAVAGICDRRVVALLLDVVEALHAEVGEVSDHLQAALAREAHLLGQLTRANQLRDDARAFAQRRMTERDQAERERDAAARELVRVLADKSSD